MAPGRGPEPSVVCLPAMMVMERTAREAETHSDPEGGTRIAIGRIIVAVAIAVSGRATTAAAITGIAGISVAVVRSPIRAVAHVVGTPIIAIAVVGEADTEARSPAPVAAEPMASPIPAIPVAIEAAGPGVPRASPRLAALRAGEAGGSAARSEERRVGKGGRRAVPARHRPTRSGRR